MVTLQNKFIKPGSYINGSWSKSGEQFHVKNPANGEVVASLYNATAEDAELAVSAATEALPLWQGKSVKERANLLRKWFELVIANKQELAALMTAEQGKPLLESATEIDYGANYIEWFAEEAKRVYGDTIPAVKHDQRIVVIKQGIGVVTAITPWNFPNAMITRKAAPALAAGCTFVVKAAAETPLSAIALAELAEQAGIPAGVFNVLTSSSASAIGKVLTQDPRVAKFSFTGSTEVGKILLTQCASTVKKTSMELGGNAPFIVFDDADIDSAVYGLMQSKFRNAGQTCVCANRILIQDGIYEEFVSRFKQATKALKVGDGFADKVEVGPLINLEAARSVKQLVSEAVSEGAKVELGGEDGGYGDSYYLPTILTDVTTEMAISETEIFGPVAPLIRFTTEEEAIAIANDTPFGLASYFYSRDIGRVWRVAESLEYGMVGINEGLISNEMAPFGGVKESGLGREGSKYGLDDFIELKYLCMGGISQ